MAFDNYWKHRYKQTWDFASRREEKVAKLIEQRTGRKIILTGLGSGSTKFLSGNAASHGYEKGAPDLHIAGTNIYLEVTGPLSKRVGKDKPLWIRPDKVENARKHSSDHEIWFVHCLANDLTLRVIRLNQDFFNQLDRGEFEIIKPLIRDTRETYIAIPANHRCVCEWEILINRLREIS